MREVHSHILSKYGLSELWRYPYIAIYKLNHFNVQTTTTRKTVNISLTEFPLYFSLLSEPGYDLRKLKSFGFPSEAEFFIGRTDNENYTKALSWSNSNASIQSTIFNLQINIRSKTNLCRDL